MDLCETGNLRRWWLFYFLPVFLLTNEVSLQETVEGFIGGSAVLPCSSEEPPLTSEDTEVLWRHRSQNVYAIIKGKVSVEGQDPQYKNRAESFPEEYMRGNFSIKLNNLQHTDAREYQCYIIDESVIRSVELLTKERPARQLPSEGTKPRPEMIELEDLLPTRADPPVISGDAEEVELEEFVSQSSSGGHRREAYNDSSDEEGGHHGPGVQCAHQ